MLAEERERRVSRITYQGGGTLTRTGSVKLGTTIGNTGIEGVAADPTGGFVPGEGVGPLGIFRTEIDWAAGTATNGSPTTENSTNLFDPALAGVTDLADVLRDVRRAARDQPGVRPDRQPLPPGTSQA